MPETTDAAVVNGATPAAPKTRSSLVERPENAENRPTFPSRGGMTPDYEVMAWRIGGINHPDKLRIITLLGAGGENNPKVLSPKDIAQALEIPLGVSSYHVRFMRERELLELAGTAPRRGALQHFYRLTAHGFEIKKVLRL